MKRFVLIIILFGSLFEVTAQNKAVDTIWFRVQNVNIVDEGFLNALDSMLLVFSQESPKSIKKLVWHIMFLDENIDGDSESKVNVIVVPSNFIIPSMRISDGFFSHKDNLFFVKNRNEKGKNHNRIFAYSNETKPFYYVIIDWKILWNSSLEESIKNQLVCKYASIEDYPSVLLTRDSDGLWTWRFSGF